MEDLVIKFHNLGGKTIGEHQKNFSLFAISLDTKDPVSIDQFLKNIEVKNLHEHLLYVKLLNRYKKSHDLYELLLKCEQPIANFIVTQKWFLQEIFTKMPVDEFLNDFLQNVSHRTKLKTINRLPKVLNEMQANYYFCGVKTNYGLRIATPLLVCCSEETIFKEIKQHRINFSHHAFVKLNKRFPSFLQTYLENLKNLHGNEKLINCEKLGQTFLNLNDIQAYITLAKHDKQKVGRKSSRKLLSTCKKEILDNYESYDFLPIYSVYRCLTYEEYKTYFKKHLPKYLEECDTLYNYHKLLKPIPIKNRGKFLNEIFIELYKEDFYSHKQIMTKDLLSLLSTEDREKILKDNVIIDDVDYTYMLRSEKSIPLIKEKIKMSADVTKRMNCVVSLIDTVIVNREYEKLAEVLQYVIGRHKNERSSSRQQILSHLDDMAIPVNKLNEDCVKYIYELTLTFIIKDEFFYAPSILALLVEFKLMHNLDYKEELKLFGKYNNLYRAPFDNQPKYQKQCIFKYMEIADEILPDLKRHEKYERILSMIYEFNKRYKKRQIPISDYYSIIEIVFEYYKESGGNDYNYEITRLGDILIKQQSSSKIVHPLLEIYFTFDACVTNTFYAQVMKKKPELFNGKLEEILMSEKAAHLNNFFAICSRMYFTETARTVEKICQKILKESSEKYCLQRALNYLSYQSDYINYIQPYRANLNVDIDLHDPNASKDLALKSQVILGLKNRLLKQNLDVVLDFCYKDYMAYTIGTLYFIGSSLPEKYVSSKITCLIDRQVSARKHILFVVADFNSNNFIEIAIKMFAKETNYSLIQFLFKRLCLRFYNNPSEKLFAFIKEVSKKLQKDDIDSITLMIRYDKIPRPYLSEYIEFVWDFLTSAKDDLKSKCISALSERELSMLSVSFISQLIEQVFKISKSFQIMSYLITIMFKVKPSESTNILELIFKLLNESGNDEKYFLKDVKRVHNWTQFLDDVYWNLLTNRTGIDTEIVKRMQYFVQRAPIRLIKDEFLFEFLLYYKNNTFISEEYAMFIKKIINNFLKQSIPNLAIYTFSERLKMSLEYIFDEIGDKNAIMLDFIRNLISIDKTVPMLLLIIELLPPVILKQYLLSQQDSIIKTLSGYNDLEILIALNKYYEKLPSA